MEDSYTVHRRRKAAAKKREKTPEPPNNPVKSEEATEDEDETRAKMERMVEDTERMEQKVEEENGKQKETEVCRSSSCQKNLVKPKESTDISEKNLLKKTKEDSSENRALARESDVTATRLAYEERETETIGKKSEASEESRIQDQQKPVRLRKRAKELVHTDSSDLENEKKKSLSRKKSPEDLKSRPRRRVNKDEDDEMLMKEKRISSKHRYSESDEESRFSKDKSRHREKRSISRHLYPSDSDEEKLSSRFFKKSAAKKQVIPLDDDSLIEDFAKAEKEYLKREHSIMEPDLEDEYIETTLRRRKGSVIYSENEKTEITKNAEPLKKSWFSWLPFFRKKKEKTDEPEEESKSKQVQKKETSNVPDVPEKVTIWEFFKALMFIVAEFREFVRQNPHEVSIILELRNACINGLILGMIYCGIGGFIFRFTEGAFESFYKCGVKRVKRDFLDSLWNYSHNLKEEDWKSMARRKLMEFEEQIHTAHEAGVQTYSGQRSWTFLNSVVYCITVVTTIGYGHIAPSTITGKAITIAYAIFGIPMFLIILADFGKLFTRGIKFLWAFVRRLYYTGSCRKVRRTAPVQEVMKGVQLVYDLATFRRPSQMNPEEFEEIKKQGNQPQTVLNLDGNMSQQPDTPGTPAMSTFDIDDEFNLPISVAIFILLGYIFVGATLFYMVEEWGFFESFYFVFISMSTIGFGDYVPKHPVYMMCSIIYLVFGLALTSMCINVVQTMLSDQFQHASQKIGATIGLEVVEDDRSIQPAPPPAVEIAEVHSTGKDNAGKEKTAPKAKHEDVDL